MNFCRFSQYEFVDETRNGDDIEGRKSAATDAVHNCSSSAACNFCYCFYCEEIDQRHVHDFNFKSAIDYVDDEGFECSYGNGSRNTNNNENNSKSAHYDNENNSKSTNYDNDKV